MKTPWMASTVAAALLLASCTVGPKYQRPTAQIPTQLRGVSPEAQQQTASLADLPWWEVFKDPSLQELIRSALKQNYDVQLAAERVTAARAQLGIARSAQYPSVTGDASLYGGKDVSQYKSNFLTLSPDAIFQLDLFGGLRKATEASRAQMLATEEARHSVIMTLVGDVAGDYFHLLTLDAALATARDTVASQQESVKLTSLRQLHGTATRVDVLQAQQVLDTANAQIPDLERQIAQTENALSILVGKLPDSIQRGQLLNDQYVPPETPAGIPSSLLERRPDIRQAEQTLIAANAEIGVARAAFFPTISLSGGGGGAFGRSNSELGSAPTHFGTWSYAASISQPIFNAGKLRNNLRVTESQQRQAVLGYQQAIQHAFGEVSDALVGRQKLHEVRLRQEASVKDLRESVKLSNERYRAGIAAYSEVLDAQRSLFAAEQSLTQAKGNELQALVTIYKVLGGGWQQ
jgi:multidrug efflux system outer membrane protein